MRRRATSRSAGLLVLGVLAFLALTVGPLPTALFDLTVDAARAMSSVLPGVPDTFPTRRQVERAANVAALIPVGALASIVAPHARTALAVMGAGAAFASVEIIQTVLPERDASMRDAALNLFGFAGGWLMIRSFQLRLDRRPPTGR